VKQATSGNESHEHNGAWWYFKSNAAFGFSGEERIQLSTADYPDNAHSDRNGPRRKRASIPKNTHKPQE